MTRVLRMLLVIAVIAVVALASRAERADAHHSASYGRAFYRERYLVCHDGTAAATRVHCVGPLRARASLLSALALGDLTAGANHSAWVDPARDAAVDAAYFHVQDAVPLLRRWLDVRLAPGDRGSYASIEKEALRTEAAYALGRLGDRASAPAIADLVRELEVDGSGSLWEDAFASLRTLDPQAASRYAIDFVKRQTDFRMSLPGGSGKLQALDAIRIDDAGEAAPVLAALAAREEHGYEHAYCEIMATRVRLDAKLHADVRAQLLSSYSGTWLAGCAESVLRRFGDAPEDAAALVRHLGRDDAGLDYGVTNLAYERVLDLEVAMIGRTDAPAVRARDVLRRGLTERSRWPHVADPRSRNYSLHFVALHFAALAGLGDAAAATRLAAVIDDASDHSGAAWLAALYALRLDIAGARDRVAALMARGATYANADRTGELFSGLRGRVLEAYVAQVHPADDARWTALLVDGELRSEASERALELVAIHTPPGACDVVAQIAPTAQPAAVEHALLALTALGDACLPQIEALADQHDAPGEVRGAALELAAVLDSPRLCAHLARARADGVWAPAIERAIALREPSCASSTVPPGHGEQPVPPRVFHQGMKR